jgi:hypothetical protein
LRKIGVSLNIVVGGVYENLPFSYRIVVIGVILTISIPIAVVVVKATFH